MACRTQSGTRALASQKARVGTTGLRVLPTTLAPWPRRKHFLLALAMKRTQAVFSKVGSERHVQSVAAPALNGLPVGKARFSPPAYCDRRPAPLRHSVPS